MSLLTRLALLRPLTVYVLMVLLVLLGGRTYLSMPRESFPEVRVPLIFVSTIYPGASPTDVESQVTREIENELQGVSGLKELRSTSLDGYSVVEAEFNPDVDLDTALQKVREGVDRAESELPDDAEEPILTDVDFSRIPIMVVALAGGFGMERLTSLADDLADRLEAIPGVNLVTVVGGRDRQVQVLADPRRLTAFGLDLQDLVETVRREHLDLPGGELDIGRQAYLVRVAGEARDPAEILDFVVSDVDGRAVRVRDVATVLYGFEDARTLSRLNRRAAVSLTVEKRTGANILEVARMVREEVDSTREALPPTAELEIVVDQSIDIRDMNDDLENNILSGLILVLIVLFVALGIRPALIVSTAIPLSMLITFLVLAAMGYTLNMIVLFSLVLLLGMLVDNAIVTVENIYRHRELGDDPMTAASRGAGEVALPIAASTATTLCAFAPLLFWPGIIGDFMRYLPMTLIVGLSASLLVALVFNPTLSLVLFRPPPRARKDVRRGRLNRMYVALLDACLERPAAPDKRAWRDWILPAVPTAGLVAAIVVRSDAGTASAAGIAVVALALLAVALRTGRDRRATVLYGAAAVLLATFGVYGVAGHGTEFFPEVDPREVWVDLEFPSGTTLEAQDAAMRELEEALAGTTDLVDQIANVGSTGLSQDPSAAGGTASNESRLSLQLARFHVREQSSRITMDRIRETVGQRSDARVTIDRPEEGVPTGKPVTVQLLGDDYDALGRSALALRERMDAIPGLLNVADDYDVGLPEYRARVDRAAAARANTDTRAVATVLRTALAGTEVAKYRDGEDDWDIVVRLPEGQRRSVDALEELTLLDEDGRSIPLRSLVTLEPTAGPAAIRRVDQRRAVTVEADVDYGRGFTDADRRAAVAAELDGGGILAPGIDHEFAGSNEEEIESTRFLTEAFFVAVLLIALILVTEFDSLITPVTILAAVVLSLIGVLWGLMITGTPFGIIMTGIGVISLAGIVVNNAIVLCDFIQQERRRGTPKRAAILQAGSIRLRPVLLTAITTVLGLIPLTTGVNLDFSTMTLVVGSESTQWWGPMGVAVIFGLGVSTVLTLLVVPVAYDVLDSLARRGPVPSGDGSGSGTA